MRLVSVLRAAVLAAALVGIAALVWSHGPGGASAGALAPRSVADTARIADLLREAQRLASPPPLSPAWRAALEFTGRTLTPLPHPLGAHASPSLFRCPEGTNNDGGADAPKNATWWPRFGRAAHPLAPACLCSGWRDRVPTSCLPAFDPRDLAAPPPPAAGGAPQPPRYNILLISLDTTRADLFPFNGAPPPPAVVAPPALPRELLDRHVNNTEHPGTVFRHAFAAAPWTLPSHAGLLTGFPSDMAGVFDDDHMLKVPQLGHHLGAAYCRLGLVNNPNLIPDTHDDAGPAHSDDLFRDRASVDAALRAFDPRRPAAVFPRRASVARRTFGWNGTEGAWDHYDLVRESLRSFEAAAAFLHARRAAAAAAAAAERAADAAMPAELAGVECARNAERPFFLFVHSNHVHNYNMDPVAYASRVAEADRALADLLDHVDFDSTIVVFTTDHGEGFHPELGRIVHTGRVHQDLVHASLVVWHPDVRGAAHAAGGMRVQETPVSALSVVPSLLAWTGYTAPPYLVAPPLPLLRAHWGDAAAEDISAVDRNYAWGLLPDGPHRWLTTVDVIATPRAARWSHHYELVPDLEVRMTVRWPLKLITTRITAPDGADALHFAAYDLVADPQERVNLLDARGRDLVPSLDVGSARQAARDADALLDGMDRFFERLRTFEHAVRGCAPLHQVGCVAGRPGTDADAGVGRFPIKRH